MIIFNLVSKRKKYFFTVFTKSLGRRHLLQERVIPTQCMSKENILMKYLYRILKQVFLF